MKYFLFRIWMQLPKKLLKPFFPWLKSTIRASH